LTEIQPLITLAIDTGYQHKETAIPQISFIFQWLGIPMTTGTIIMVMFAGWGIWHWVIMAGNAWNGLPKFIKVVKRYLNKEPEGP
jgi:hypothetical protein